jgi:uncharacterized repeat protein (TIGR01451 family)
MAALRGLSVAGALIVNFWTLAAAPASDFLPREDSTTPDRAVLGTAPSAPGSGSVPQPSTAGPGPERTELRSAPQPPTPPEKKEAGFRILQAGPDLAVTKTDSADPVGFGGDFFYQITVTNQGDEVATGPTLDDTLPASLSYVSAGSSLVGPPGGVCILSGIPVDVSCTFPDMNPGDTFVLTLHVQANTPGLITNTATAATTGTDHDPSNNSASQETLITGTDIAVTKTDSADPVPVGGDFSYVITVTNQSQGVASNVTLDDTLPASLSYLSAGSSLVGPPGGVCILSGIPVDVSCAFPDMNPGDTFVLTLHVQVNAIGPITNTATASTSTADDDLTNNSASQDTSIVGVDIGLEKTESSDPVIAGSGPANLTYSVTATNVGGLPATGVGVLETLNLPSGVTVDSVTPSGSTTVTGATPSYTWTIGSLAAGASETLTVIVTVGAGTSPGIDIISDTATVTVVNELDGNPANDSVTESTSVSAPTNVTATKTVDGATHALGTITYTVTLTNNAPFDAPDDPAVDEFTDTLPPETTLVDATVTSGGGTVAAAGNTVTWNGPIPAGASVVLTITATVNWGVVEGTIVSNQGWVSYDADGNGTNEATRPTDDPAAGGDSDPTAFAALALATIPEMDIRGVALLVLLIAVAGWIAANRMKAA